MFTWNVKFHSKHKIFLKNDPLCAIILFRQFSDVGGITDWLKGTIFSSSREDDGLQIVLKRQLLLSRPMRHQRRLAYISCTTKCQRMIASWRPCRRMCRCTSRAARSQSSSPSYGAMHHNGYRIYQQFQPSSCASPETRVQRNKIH